MPYTNTNINDKGQVGIKKFGIDPLSGLVPPVNSFIFTVDTTKAGTAADTFELSLIAAGAISMDIYWGDATMDTITVWNQVELTHVYPAPGVYTVSIANEVRGVKFSFGPDNLKILNISNWGEFNFTNTYTFNGCNDLTCNATDIPTISTADMTYNLANCYAFNGDVTGWDVSGCTNLRYCFLNDAAFTGIGISTWDVSAVTDLNWMFGSIMGSVFNADISGWNTNNVSTMDGTFYGCVLFNQDLSGWNATGSLTEIDRAFQGATAFDQNLSAWDVSNVINYADFLTGGTLSTANYDALLIGWDAQAVQAAQVPNFGNSIFTNCAGAAFTARENLINSDGWTITDGGGVPATCPFTFTVDTTNAGSANDTFVLPLVSDGAISIDVDWGDATTDTIIVWNQAEVTHVYAASGIYTVKLGGTIRGFRFNNGGDKEKILDISEWGAMNITQSSTFQGCANLTASATDAPTIGTTDLSYTFWNAPNFNGVCDGWDVSAVTNMGGVFGYSAFNQPLSSWNTAAATSMTQMFGGLTTFDQDISAWNVAAVTNMGSMFSGCTVFNQNISSWNTGSVTSMSSMFRTCTAFDQPIGSWNVSSVSNLSQTFFGCTVFDQDLSSWNTGSLTTAWGTFYNATSFDQDISAWDVTGLTDATSFFSGVTLSTANYDALLIGWDAQVLQAGTVFSGGNSVYSCGTAEAARANMIASDTWTITDGGSVPNPCPIPFTFSVDTTETGSANDTFVLPLVNDGVINMVVNWGDATTDTIIVYNQAEITHVYAAPGTYTIEITGTIRGWKFNGAGDRRKMQVISKWGVFDMTQSNAFQDCRNMTCTAADAPTISTTDMGATFYRCDDLTGLGTGISLWDVSSVTNFYLLFYQDTHFNGDVSNWDVGNVTNFYLAFFRCNPFNQDLSGWDTSSATNITGMFKCHLAPFGSFDQDLSGWDISSVNNMGEFLVGQTLSTANYDALLIGWDAQAVIAAQIPDFGNSIYTNCAIAAAARANLISSDGWTITDGGGVPASCSTPFTFSVDTTASGSAADTFVVPLVSNGAIDLVIDWGDATSDVIVIWNDPNLTHVYAASGTYTITITATTGSLRGWTFGWGGDKAKMRVVSQWGDFEFTNSAAFTQSANMTCTATDIPNITTTSMAYVFFGCSNWNPANAGLWDVSSCTSINSFWSFCTLFNQDVDAWDVSNVTDFGGVFYGTAFNYPLLNWDTGSGNSFNQMFFGTPFNQDIDMWDMSSAASLYSMFYNCTAFNQDLNSWNTSSVTNISYIFTGCTVFDGDVSSWDTSSVTNFAGMFLSCAIFNQNISAWVVSAGTNFSYMFRFAAAFDQNISGWNVGNATTMQNMFDGATAFNQNISAWNTANVGNMNATLQDLPSFDQDLGGWNVTSVTNLTDFLQGGTLSTANYDSLLSGWDAQVVNPGLTPHFGGSIYTNCGVVAAARANLIAADTWTITDGGGVPASCSTPFTFTVKTDNAGVSANDEFKIPLVNDGTVLNFVVDWGDATSDTITVWNDWHLQHVYPAVGTYTIEITGTMGGWRFWWGGDKDKFLEISEWGDFDFTTYGAFAGCGNLTCIATDIPNITGTSLGYTFYSCTNFNGLVAGWSMGAITDINGMFTGCTNFNQPGVIAWDVSNCQGFSATFTNCSVFDQDISGWNVSSGTNFQQMFSGCTIFNQDLDGWNVSSATGMGSMFQSCPAFNQDLNSWNTSNVTSMNDMFYGCTIFNGDITSWDVAAVTNFQNTFNSCTAFTQDLSAWDLGSCTRTIGMFQSCVAFNADISGWDMADVTYAGGMFRTATVFNQDIGGWNTALIENMSNMLRECPAFDQDLSAWDISSVTDLGTFMTGTTLSTVNYDALLVGWEAQVVVSGLVPNFGGSIYSCAVSPAATARAALIASDLWTITDGGCV
jgi:surface protein